MALRDLTHQIGRGIFAACLAAFLAVTAAISQETASLEQIPGHRIDADWYRYTNEQYGLEADIPTTGYDYELGDLGDELSLTSPDGEQAITVYGSQDVDPNLRGQNLTLAFAALADAQIDAMRLGGIEVTLEHTEPLWFEVAATDLTYLYFQKGLVDENCPTLTANLWIKFPVGSRKEFDKVVQRMAKSLTIECAAE